MCRRDGCSRWRQQVFVSAKLFIALTHSRFKRGPDLPLCNARRISDEQRPGAGTVSRRQQKRRLGGRRSLRSARTALLFQRRVGRAEVIVHASAHRAQFGVDGVDIITRRIRRVIVAKVDILVLSLHRPGRLELVLDAPPST